MDGQMAFNICDNDHQCLRKGGEADELHLVNGFRANESLDPEPKQGQNHSADDTKIAQPESKRGAIKDGERYVKSGTDGAIQYHDNRQDSVP